ncbi:hypothetical protein [Nocardia sp. alder85J]|uniref:hypothetical protein n=1 Tax=Nocardia sp. alder85J TaxID=2862949 RepID=UPI001CD59543|nr:hypothetical protein [Nocardia sp. alder85J]MCX4091913.1 hypothetical protein [Nocardia sp. alder85J]
MAISLRVGDQLASTTCSVRVVVVRVPADRQPLIECGGAPMAPAAPGKPTAPAPGAATATLVGKRYVDAAGTVELLCVAPGSGTLSCDGEPMAQKAAKALPASD